MTIAKKLGIAVTAAAFATATMGSAFAASHSGKTKLRIQTHFSTETLSGKMAQQYVKDVQEMSNGEIEIEMFYASSVVKSVETFDAAVNGILDCDMTGGAYQTGKNPAFQACNKKVWDKMPAHHQKIMSVAMEALALRNATINEVKNAENAVALRAKGINLYEWSPEELAKYRDAVQKGWVEFATTPEAKDLLEAHIKFLKGMGAMK